MGASLADMPIRLDAAQVAHLPTARRNVFVSRRARLPWPMRWRRCPVCRAATGGCVRARHRAWCCSTTSRGCTSATPCRRWPTPTRSCSPPGDWPTTSTTHVRAGGPRRWWSTCRPATRSTSGPSPRCIPDALFVHATDDADDLTDEPFWSADRPPRAAPDRRTRAARTADLRRGLRAQRHDVVADDAGHAPAVGGPKEETAIFAAIARAGRQPGARRVDGAPINSIAAMRRFALRLFAHCLATEAPCASRLLGEDAAPRDASPDDRLRVSRGDGGGDLPRRPRRRPLDSRSALRHRRRRRRRAGLAQGRRSRGRVRRGLPVDSQRALRGGRSPRPSSASASCWPGWSCPSTTPSPRR